MRFYTTQQISAKREKTPEGFLLCRDVPVARTGMQTYNKDELPYLDAGADGIINVMRDADEVFRPETIASANGKPFVNNHPDDDVTPDNWRDLAYGFFMNPRRGTGLDQDVLLADLLVTDAMGIGLIESGKTELSCGYDAEYEQTGPGSGRQKNIIINHIALVDSGRCGPRCSIGDQRMTTHDCNCQKETGNMTARMKIRDALKLAGFRFKDAESAEAMEKLVEKEATGDSNEPMGGAGEGDQHIHVHLGPAGGDGKEVVADDKEDGDDDTPPWFKKYSDSSEERFKKIEDAIGAMGERGGGGGESKDKIKDEEETAGEMEAEMPEGTTGDMKGVKDSAMLDDSFQNTVALAEIIAPGIAIPTFDAKAAPKKTLDGLRAFRTKTLDLAWNFADTRGFIEEITKGKRPDFAKMRTGDVRTMFFAVAAAKKRANKARDDNGGGVANVLKDAPIGAIRTISDLNRRNADFYKNH